MNVLRFVACLFAVVFAGPASAMAYYAPSPSVVVGAVILWAVAISFACGLFVAVGAWLVSACIESGFRPFGRLGHLIEIGMISGPASAAIVWLVAPPSDTGILVVAMAVATILCQATFLLGEWPEGEEDVSSVAGTG